jgi:hypothetical protein
MMRKDFDSLVERVEKYFAVVCPADLKDRLWDRVRDYDLPDKHLTLVFNLLEGMNSSEPRITHEEFAREIYKMEKIKGVRCPDHLIEGFWKQCSVLDSKSFQFVMSTIFEKQRIMERTSHHNNS